MKYNKLWADLPACFTKTFFLLLLAYKHINAFPKALCFNMACKYDQLIDNREAALWEAGVYSYLYGLINPRPLLSVT